MARTFSPTSLRLHIICGTTHLGDCCERALTLPIGGSDAPGTSMLRRLQHHVLRLEERALPYRAFEREAWSGGPVISISCDDGVATDLEKIIPALDEFNVKASFAVCSQLIDTPGYLTRKDLAALSRAGHEAASHMDVHVPVTSRPPNEVGLAMLHSKDAIQSMTNTMPTSLVYPYGLNDRKVRSRAHQHFACGVTTWLGINNGIFNRYAIRRVPFGSFTKPGHNQFRHYERTLQAAIDGQAWLVWMIHSASQDHDAYQTECLRRLIDRALSAGAQIRPIREALLGCRALGSR